MTTRARKSKAMRFLEELSGGPLTIGELLKAIREGEEWSQSAMGELLGVTAQHISDVENGRRTVSPERAARWAKSLGYGEKQFVRLALQDLVDQAQLKLRVSVEAA